MMNYNAGTATLRDRGSYGLTYTFNYTYARAMTNSAANYNFANTSVQNGSFQDGYNGHADYGPSGSDVRNNFNGTILYTVPFGRGKQFGNNTDKALDLIAGGWSVSGTIVAYSGFPISINGPQVSNTSSDGQSHANPYRKLRVVNRSVNNWFGTDPSATACADNGICAYDPTTTISFGTAAVGSQRTPGYTQADFSAFKDFRLFESHTIGFRADAFNALNIASYGNPDNIITDSNFGQITNTRSLPRILQLALHYTF